ncbi:MAG: MOSC domain-containing protein [Pseudomonadota bacterium]
MVIGATVAAVHRDSEHRFSKQPTDKIRMIAGLGVEGDAHAGKKVQHLSRVRADPTQPNLRQVHLMHAELFDELKDEGFIVRPGDLGENITTTGIDLLGLGRGTLLHIGKEAVVEVTGLRNPCGQIDNFAPGLLKHVALKTPAGIVRKAGIMGITLAGGEVRAGDAIRVEAPPGPYLALERV